MLFFLLGVFIIFIPKILAVFETPPEVILTLEEIQELKEASIQKTNTDHFKNGLSKKKKKTYKIPPQRFDPNLYSLQEWIALGLSEKQVRVILKFLKNGIDSNEALEKIYVLPKELYALIKDSTIYPAVINTGDQELSTGIELVVVQRILELNSIDSLALISLKGIGPFYASQILKYRRKLGGYYKKEQLLEVWKMKIETYEQLISQLVIDNENIRKIPLNTISFEDLYRHPYLSYAQANSIVKMRVQQEGFTSIGDVLKSKLIDRKTYERLRPYLILK